MNEMYPVYPLAPASSAGQVYQRIAIQTHFVRPGEDYTELFHRYVLPLYRRGDLVIVSEKVAALCQGRVVYREEIRVTALARFLAHMVEQTPAGPGMGVPEKMQFAIDLCGAGRVLWAAVRAGIDKLRGKRGTFYRLLSPEVRGLDGFYGEDIPEYADMGVRLPEAPDELCRALYQETGVLSFIVDANDLGAELLGAADGTGLRREELLELARDNPAGQDRRLTPFVLCRPAAER